MFLRHGNFSRPASVYSMEIPRPGGDVPQNETPQSITDAVSTGRMWCFDLFLLTISSLDSFEIDELSNVLRQ